MISLQLNLFRRGTAWLLFKELRKKAPRMAPKFPGDSPFRYSGNEGQGKSSNFYGNGPKTFRKRLWYAVAGASVFLIGGIILPNLEKTPITERWRIMLVNLKQETMLGSLAANSLIQQNSTLFLPYNDPSVILIHKVVRRILSAALITFPELFPPGATLGDILKSFPIKVIRSPMVNASVLPGILFCHLLNLRWIHLCVFWDPSYCSRRSWNCHCVKP